MKHRVGWHINNGAYDWIYTMSRLKGCRCHEIVEEITIVSRLLRSADSSAYDAAVKMLSAGDDSPLPLELLVSALEVAIVKMKLHVDG